MNNSLSIDRLRKHFPVSGGMLHAVDDVSLDIGKGESVGLVGESGCGKSTLVRVISRLIDPTAGAIRIDGRDIGNIPARKFGTNPDRARIQVVFQDPTDSLNPQFRVFDSIADPLRRLGPVTGRDAIDTRVRETANLVGLPLELLTRFPHQLSGGQKARVGIARAIVVEPELLILDEPTSALDVSVQVVILHLLSDLRAKRGMSYLFVSHDLNVVKLLCDRVAVMYLGRIVELASVETLFDKPKHPYTQALLSAIPGTGYGEQLRLSGEPRSPINPSSTACRFHGRCPRGEPRCEKEMPELVTNEVGHAVACHFSDH
jgi:oligopeptide/dipeptide ABC transporter ATP-binding protein